MLWYHGTIARSTEIQPTQRLARPPRADASVVRKPEAPAGMQAMKKQGPTQQNETPNKMMFSREIIEKYNPKNTENSGK